MVFDAPRGDVVIGNPCIRRSETTLFMRFAPQGYWMRGFPGATPPFFMRVIHILIKTVARSSQILYPPNANDQRADKPHAIRALYLCVAPASGALRNRNRCIRFTATNRKQLHFPQKSTAISKTYTDCWTSKRPQYMQKRVEVRPAKRTRATIFQGGSADA